MTLLKILTMRILKRRLRRRLRVLRWNSIQSVMLAVAEKEEKVDSLVTVAEVGQMVDSLVVAMERGQLVEAVTKGSKEGER